MTATWNQQWGVWRLTGEGGTLLAEVSVNGSIIAGGEWVWRARLARGDVPGRSPTAERAKAEAEDCLRRAGRLPPADGEGGVP